MTFTAASYELLADCVLIAHAAFVAFVVFGLAMVWAGRHRWAWVRNRWFRLAHLGAIGLVAAESGCGMECPLTVWENKLRQLAGGEGTYPHSFVAHWLHHLLFFDLSELTFGILYAAFFLLVLLSLWLVPPNWKI